jgi:hypothetical protein
MKHVVVLYNHIYLKEYENIDDYATTDFSYLYYGKGLIVYHGEVTLAIF